MVLGYVHAPETKKAEVLQLVAKILDFTSDELEQARLCGHDRNKSWLAGFWKRPHAIPPQQSEVISEYTTSAH